MPVVSAASYCWGLAIHSTITTSALIPLQVEVHTYPLAQANAALADLRAGRLRGAAVLLPSG